MPLTGPVPDGTSFFCPSCGALYSVTHAQRPKRERNIAKCVICLHIMAKWDSIRVPIYKLASHSALHLLQSRSDVAIRLEQAFEAAGSPL
jgi:hypothetical protein